MKNLLSILFVLFAFASSAQTSTPAVSKPKAINAVIDSSGNYVQPARAQAAAAKPTSKTFTLSDGTILPVMEGAKGGLYVIRTSKAGKQYKMYLNTEN